MRMGNLRRKRTRHKPSPKAMARPMDRLRRPAPLRPEVPVDSPNPPPPPTVDVAVAYNDRPVYRYRRGQAANIVVRPDQDHALVRG